MATREFLIRINGELSSSFTSAMRSAQNAMKAVKSQKINIDSNLPQKLSELQRLQQQLENYKSAMRQVPKMQEQYRQQVQRTSSASAQRQSSAEKVAQLKLQIEAMRAAQSNLKRTSTEYKNLQSQIKNTRQELKLAAEAQKTAENAFKTSRYKQFDIGQSLQRQIAELERLRGALNSAGVNLNALGQHELRLQSQINATTAAMQRQQQIFERRAAARANYEAAQSNLSEAQSNFSTAQNVATTLMNPFVSSAANAMDYEYELTNVKALTQLKNIRGGDLEKVNAAMAELDATFRRIGATTEYTSLQVAQSAGYFAMAGWDSKRIQAVIPAFINMATATRTSGAELARLADVFSDDMTAAGLKAGEMVSYGEGLQMEASEYFANAFTYAVTNANLNRESLHESVKYFAPVAKQMGLSVSEMFATTMLTANAGIKGSQMGTAFRAGLLRMIAPTKAAAGALAEMGMDMSDAQKQYQEAQAVLREMGVPAGNFTEQITKMAQVFSTMSREEKLAKLNAIVGRNAVSAWAEIFENPEKVAQIAEYAKYMNSAQIGGYAGDTANVMRESAHVQFELLKSSIDAVSQSVGKALLPEVIQITKNLAPLLTNLSEWIAKNPQLVRNAAMLAAGISAVAVGATGLAVAFAGLNFVTTQLGLLRAALFGLSTFSFAGIASAVSGIGSAFLMAARAAMALCLTPIGAVLGLAAFLVYKNWDKIAPLFSRLGDILSKVGSKIKTAFKNAFPTVAKLIDKVADFLHLGDSEVSFDANAPDKLPAAEAVRRHRQDATSEQIQSQTRAITHGQLQRTLPNQAAVQRHRSDSSQQQILAQFRRIDLDKKIADTRVDFGYRPGQNYSISNALFDSMNQRAALVNAKVNTNTQLDTSNVQTQLNNLGNSAQENSAALQNSTVSNTNVQTQFQNLSAVAQINSAAFMSTTAAAQNVSTSFSGTSSAAANMASTLDVSANSVVNMAATADNSTASIQNLAASSGGAAGSVSGLGAAAAAAISSLLSAAATAASNAVSNVKSFFGFGVSENYSGGIYNQGAFLTWFAEKSPEAAIPLDGSQRAIQLWQQAGQILGVYPGGNVNFDNPTDALTIQKPRPLNIGSLSDLTFENGTIWGQGSVNVPNIDSFKSIFDKVLNIDSFKNIFDRVLNLDSFKNIFDKVLNIDSFKNIFDRVLNIDSFKSIFDKVLNLDSFKNIFDRVLNIDSFKSIFDKVLNLDSFKNIFDRVLNIDSFKNIFDKVLNIDSFKNIFDRVLNLESFKSIFDKVLNLDSFKNIFDRVLNLESFKSIFDKVLNLDNFKSIFDRISNSESYRGIFEQVGEMGTPTFPTLDDTPNTTANTNTNTTTNTTTNAPNIYITVNVSAQNLDDFGVQFEGYLREIARRTFS